MFAQLLKHIFRSQRKLLLLLSAAALGIGAIGSIFSWVMSSAVESGINDAAREMQGVFSAMMIMGVCFSLAGYVVAVWILLVYRFYKSNFSQEGYLTFTLPVTTHQVLLANIVNIVIWTLIASLVCLISFGLITVPFIRIIAADMGDMPADFSMLAEQFGAGNILLQLYSWLSSAVYALILPLLSVVLGSLAAKKHKLLAGFGIYYGINAAISILSGIITTVSLFVEISSGINENFFTVTAFLSATIQLTIGVAGYCLMHYLVDKKLNLP